MAGRNSPIDKSLVNDLTFECSVCTESVGVEFRVYPCSHYNCSACIDDLIAASNLGDSAFVCPTCEEVVVAPDGGLPLRRVAPREQMNPRLDNNPLPAVAEQEVPVENNGNEQQENAYMNEYKRLLENDQRCEISCHRSCQSCGTKFLELFTSTFTNIGGDTYGDQRCYKKCLILPFWVFQLLRIVNPCIGVFNPGGQIQSESEEIVQMRDEARRAILRVQPSIFPSWFRIIWSFFLVMALLMFVGIDVYNILSSGEFMFSSAEFVLSIVFCSINGLLAIMWLTFAIMNLTRYKSDDSSQIEREGNSITHFTMEQIQQFLSELSVYPQLCISSILLHKMYVPTIISFSVCSIIILIVFSLRLYTVVKLRRYVKLYFGRLLFSFVGNYLVIAHLVTTLVVISCSSGPIINTSSTCFFISISLIILILISTPWNQLMFYISHLYEVSLQCGLNLLLLNSADPLLIIQVATRLTGLESFHKNMYPMAIPSYGMIICFWTWPSLGVLMIYLFTSNAYLDTNVLLYLAYFALFISVNFKALLLTVAAYFTLFVIILIFTFVCFLATMFAGIIYGAIAGTLCVLCICACMAHTNTTTNRPMYDSYGRRIIYR